MQQKNNIVFIGFMGTGKTLISNLLANKKALSLIDTDDLIVEKSKLPIVDIFAQKGEKHFRDLETNILKSLLDKEKSIISTGGGIILKEENRKLLKQLGLVIWLQADTEAIINRLKHDTSRPLLQGSDDEKKQKIQSLLTTRNSLYQACSDLIIDTSSLTPTDIITKIEKNFS